MKNVKIILFSAVFAVSIANALDHEEQKSALQEVKEEFLFFAQNCDQIDAVILANKATDIKNNNSRNLTIEDDLAIHVFLLEELRKKDECLGWYNQARRELSLKQASIYKYAKKGDTLHKARVLDLKHNPDYTDYRRIHCKECTDDDYENIQEKLNDFLRNGDIAEYRKLSDEIGMS